MESQGEIKRVRGVIPGDSRKKLTDKEVDEIRQAGVDRKRICSEMMAVRKKLIEEYSDSALAKDYGVSLVQIGRIINHQSRRCGG